MMVNGSNWKEVAQTLTEFAIDATMIAILYRVNPYAGLAYTLL